MGEGAMTTESLPVQVAYALYARLEERARQTRRSVEEALAEALAGALVLADDPLPADLAAELAALDTMADDGLWDMARASHLTSTAAAYLEEQNHRRQREGLSTDEQRIIEALLHQYERAVLVRAAALAQLKERGHDISPLPRSATA